VGVCSKSHFFFWGGRVGGGGDNLCRTVSEVNAMSVEIPKNFPTPVHLTPTLREFPLEFYNGGEAKPTRTRTKTRTRTGQGLDSQGQRLKFGP